MALKKSIKQENGVTTEYHRILFIQSVLNSHVSIAVLSYIDEESRNNEKAYEENTTEEKAYVTPYKTSITYEKAYEESTTEEKAYEYLKTLPEFEGAEDV